MIVESSPNATTMMGVSRALPARWLGVVGVVVVGGKPVVGRLGVGVMGGVAMLRRSEGSSRKVVSEETMGAWSASQAR